jgi:hypothetical protein
MVEEDPEFSLKKEDKSRTEDLIIEAKKFFDFYKKELGKSVEKGSMYLFRIFKMAEFSTNN